MAKRKKQERRPSGGKQRPVNTAAPTTAQALSANPPAKNPSLLVISIVLFALWFAFLLVTALME